MGRGNVNTTGAYEGLFYVSNANFEVYRRHARDDSDEECEVRLLAGLSNEELQSGEWGFDEIATSDEYEDIKDSAVDAFCAAHPCFEKSDGKSWLGPLHVLAESKLFYLAVEDNDWAMAFELLQKDDAPAAFQKKLYKKYLGSLKRALLERVPVIYERTSAWTSGTITREEVLGA